MHVVCLVKMKKEYKTFKETGDSRYNYQNELDKFCFQHDIADGDFKDLNKKQLLIKYYIIKHLIFLKMQDTMNITWNCFNGL